MLLNIKHYCSEWKLETYHPWWINMMYEEVLLLLFRYNHRIFIYDLWAQAPSVLPHRVQVCGLMENSTSSPFSLYSQSGCSNHSHYGLRLAADDIITTTSQLHHQLMQDCCTMSQWAWPEGALDNTAWLCLSITNGFFLSHGHWHTHMH